MNDLSPFQFDGRNVRFVDRNGETWFVATDAARELGYRMASDMTRTLDDDEKGTHTMRTPSGDQELAIISEPGLYRAIIQRRANKKHDEALLSRIARFQRWVFHDILPSIRRTGSYTTQAAPTLDFDNPRLLQGLLLEHVAKRIEAEGRAAELEGQVEEMRPQIQALERIAISDGSLCITDAAKTLQIAPKALFRYLREHRWIYTRPGTSGDIAYQERLISGDLEHKTTTVLRPDGTEKTVTQVRVTPKGLTKLAKLLPPVATAA